jgi:hypothetical protein
MLTNPVRARADAKGLKPKTIVDYNSAAKRFLVFCGFEIDEKKFRNKVSTPLEHLMERRSQQ